MQTFRIVWLLRNLNFNVKLCLSDEKNADVVSSQSLVGSFFQQAEAKTTPRWSRDPAHLSDLLAG